MIRRVLCVAALMLSLPGLAGSGPPGVLARDRLAALVERQDKARVRFGEELRGDRDGGPERRGRPLPRRYGREHGRGPEPDSRQPGGSHGRRGYRVRDRLGQGRPRRPVVPGDRPGTARPHPRPGYGPRLRTALLFRTCPGGRGPDAPGARAEPEPPRPWPGLPRAGELPAQPGQDGHAGPRGRRRSTSMCTSGTRRPRPGSSTRPTFLDWSGKPRPCWSGSSPSSARFRTGTISGHWG